LPFGTNLLNRTRWPHVVALSWHCHCGLTRWRGSAFAAGACCAVHPLGVDVAARRVLSGLFELVTALAVRQPRRDVLSDLIITLPFRLGADDLSAG